MHFDDNMWVLEDMANTNMKKLMKGMTAITLTVSMLLTCIPLMPLEVFAADTRIATMNGEDYWNFHSLVSDLNSKGGESVTIDMLRDFEIIESTYKNNINKGKATVIVHGTGDDWGGFKTLTFTIGSKGIVWWIRNLLNL